jgi:transposase-like protein
VEEFMGQHYSAGFKERILKKLLHPNSKGLSALSREVGIPISTLATWKRKLYLKNTSKTSSNDFVDWDYESKVNAVLKFETLEGAKLGLWLRKIGIHSNTLNLWKDEIINMNTLKKEYQDELKISKKRIKELESELLKKDKALAEASALLILKKKAHLIWGNEES